MPNSTLRIVAVGRAEENGLPEEITLAAGMNMLVGQPNTGKSSWLKLIDYLLGSTKDNPEEALGEQLANKYTRAWADFELGGAPHRAERRWSDRGGKSRILLDDKSISAEEFSHFVLSELGAPVIRYPRGNPYADRSWATLSWRTLMRHVYRREDQWVDLVPKQPEGEIHACVLEFAGLAEAVYPSALGDLVEKRRLVEQLIARRENFAQTLRQVTEELLGLGLPDGTLSEELIETAHRDLALKRLVLEKHRATTAAEGLPTADPLKERRLATIADELAETDSRVVELAELAESLRKRITELSDHIQIVRSEGLRLRRAIVAGTVLADLRVTHCPACDKPVTVSSGSCCYVCGNPDTSENSAQANDRLHFESSQVKDEATESERLLAALNDELRELNVSRSRLEHGRSELRAAFASITGNGSVLDDPRLREIDMQLGSMGAREAQISSVGRLLGRREELSQEIEQLEDRIRTLESEIEDTQSEADFEAASTALTDAMNEYLRGLNVPGHEDRWPFDGGVSFDLRKNGFSLRIEGKSWTSKLGGTLRLYLYLAYHYALITAMSPKAGHYPGLVILDFPPDRMAASLGLKLVSEHEVYVLEAFADLCAKNPDLQVIATGHRYGGLSGNRIELEKVWK